MIVPLSVSCTDRAIWLQQMFAEQLTYLSHFSGDRNPAEMFAGVKMRLTIAIWQKQPQHQVFTTDYLKWFTDARPQLFHTLTYETATMTSSVASIPKTGSQVARRIVEKMATHTGKAGHNLSRKQFGYYYHDAPIHWIRAFAFTPFFWSERDGEKVSSHFKPIWMGNEADTKLFITLMNSSLFYSFFVWWSNCRDLTTREVSRFPFSPSMFEPVVRAELLALGTKLMAQYRDIAQIIEVNYRTSGLVRYEQIDTKQCKSTMDEIDGVLGLHFSLLEDELDYVKNFHHKFRIGRGAAGL